MRANPIMPCALRVLAVLVPAVLLAAGGPRADELKFTPMMEVREDYNNNLFFDSTRVRASRDTITTVSPGFRLSDRTESVDAYLQSWAHVLKYRENDDLDTTDQDHSGNVRWRITERWNGSADGRFTRDSRVDKDFEESGNVTGNVRRDRAHYGASTDYRLSEKAACSLSYSYQKDRFDDPEYENSTIQNSDLGFSYDLESLVGNTVALIDAGYTLYKYPVEDVVENYFTVGVRKRLLETLSVTGLIGRTYTRSSFDTFAWEIVDDSPFPVLTKRGDRSRQQGTIGRLGLSYRGERATAELTFNDYVRGLSGDVGTARRKSVLLDVRYRFTRKLAGSLAAERFQDKSNDRKFAANDVNEQNLRIQPGGYYYFTDDLYLHASYRFYRQHDSEDHLVYKQSLCSIRIVWQYPVTR
jgi:hypothetical protein